MRVFLLFLFVGLAKLLFSVETIVQGNISSFNGKTIRVSKIDDYISFKSTPLCKGEIKNNTFLLQFDIDRPQRIHIDIEDKQATFYAEPGEVYNVNLNYDEPSNEGLAYFKNLSVRFSYPRAKELNQLIKKFNTDYEEFFDQHYQQIILKGAKKKVDAFINKWEQQCTEISNDYAKNYIIYSLASLERISYISEEALYKKYFNTTSPLYNNSEYMSFFKQLYDKDFESMALSKRGTEVLKSIVINSDLEESIRFIKEYKSFDSDAFAELYLLNGLSDIFHQPLIDQESSLEMLEHIYKHGQNIENKEIANNLIEKLSLFSNVSTVPSFTLENTKGDSTNLESLFGKPIYIGFWANWSISSRRELSVIKKLHEQYGKDMHFISINLDKDFSKVITMAKQNEFNWQMLHIGDNYKLREQYEALTLPAYYLIDSKGKMLRAFAKGPTEVQAEIHRLLRRN